MIRHKAFEVTAWYLNNLRLKQTVKTTLLEERGERVRRGERSLELVLGGSWARLTSKWAGAFRG